MTSSDAVTTEPAGKPPKAKHPRGLYTLFFTEMWERFSYYGMRALLFLFMVAAIEEEGLGLTEVTAGAIYGLYTAAVYLVALPGGWVADRLLGAQRSVWYGGIIIAAGHFALAVPRTDTFFIGLILVVCGTGLLKPNISAIVGELYPEGGTRRDAGFTIFYMGINLGAFIGPLICSFLGEEINWHYGFGAAGVGMVLGLIQYKLTSRHLGEAGLYPQKNERREGKRISGLWYLAGALVVLAALLFVLNWTKAVTFDTGALAGNGKCWVAGLFAVLLVATVTLDQSKDLDRGWFLFVAGVSVLVLLVGLGLTGIVVFHPDPLAENAKYGIAAIGALYFLSVFLFGKLDGLEKRRMVVLLVLVIASLIFWSGFEQAGSTLNLFAERFTDRGIDVFNFEIPAGWFQSLNPIYIIVFAPVFASLWVALGRRNLDPSLPVKFALGLILMGLGFLIMVGASALVVAGNKVLPFWLIFTYMLHTFGELCLSPVGLSSVTKLAPRRFVGQMMGLWFLATSLGNLIAGLYAQEFTPDQVDRMPFIFLRVVLIAGGAGVALLLLARPLKRLMGNVR